MAEIRISQASIELAKLNRGFIGVFEASTGNRIQNTDGG